DRRYSRQSLVARLALQRQSIWLAVVDNRSGEVRPGFLRVEALLADNSSKRLGETERYAGDFLDVVPEGGPVEADSQGTDRAVQPEHLYERIDHEMRQRRIVSFNVSRESEPSKTHLQRDRVAGLNSDILDCPVEIVARVVMVHGSNGRNSSRCQSGNSLAKW